MKQNRKYVDLVKDNKMQRAVLLGWVLFTTILHTDQSTLIETKETVWAAVGDQASLSCRLTEDKKIFQITWLKVLPDGEKTLATYIKDFGSRVRPDLEEKMDFQYESLHSCSMVIRKVTEEDEGCYRCLFHTYLEGALIGWTCLKPYGLAAVIQTQQTVLAAVGEDAPLSCQLLETKDVQQVTWQKVLEKTERNIGSYSQYFGETVNDGFKDKVRFTEAGLQKNSIVIRNITEQDAGCYLCLFNTYPDGALTGRTCLRVYELHGPFIDFSRSNSPPGSVVTCSATGRPVPMVTLTVSDQNLRFSHCNTSRETNTNGTITITTTALLSALSSTQVGCSVSVDSAAPRELMVNVPDFKDSSDNGLNKQSESDFRGFRWPLIAVFLVILICICVLQFRRIFQNRKMKPSGNSTDNQNLDDSPVLNKDVRLRTSDRQTKQ